MKKILLVLMLVLTFALSGCKKEVDYNCQITGRENTGYEVWQVADYYEVDDGIVKLYKRGGAVLEYDLDNLVVFCSEMVFS